MNKKAFTLVELLVVVLIIGILAAIAVPKYQMAVLKSRAGQVMSLVRSIANAQEVFHLSNSRYANNFSELDLTIPATSGSCVYDQSTNLCYNIGNDWELTLWGTRDNAPFAVQARYKNLINITNYLENGKNINSASVNFIRQNGGNLTCEAINNEEKGRKLCEALGGTEIPSTFKGYYRL